MKSKLSPRESFSLYGFLLGFIFLFYLVGLVVGKNHFTGGEPLSGDPSRPRRTPSRHEDRAGFLPACDDSS